MKTTRKKAEHYRSRKYITEGEFWELWNGRTKGRRESERRILRYKAILGLLFFHGLRKNELYELKWEAIDFRANSIFIKRCKQGKDSIHPLVKKEIPILKGLQESTKGKYVIDNPMGGKLSPTALNFFFKRINEKRIIEITVHPHMLRHACGYYLANKGMDTRAIQVYLGHSSIRSTEIYTEINPSRFESFFNY